MLIGWPPMWAQLLDLYVEGFDWLQAEYASSEGS
jgi:hypothetical protein